MRTLCLPLPATHPHAQSQVLGCQGWGKCGRMLPWDCEKQVASSILREVHELSRTCFETLITIQPCSARTGSVNFRDVMLAYGKLSKDLMTHGHGGHQIGLEFSGKVQPIAFPGVGFQFQTPPCGARGKPRLLLWSVPAADAPDLSASTNCASTNN